jgi:hypothetical protein
MVTISSHSSAIAEYVQKQDAISYSQLQRSNAFGLAASGIFEKLRSLFIDCSHSGWDGENAEPISNDVLRNTWIFLQSLPLGMEAPSVGAEPDGSITLEWYRSSSRVLSISINSDSRMYYAALNGISRRHGSDVISGYIADDIIEIINQITKEK